MIPVAAGIRILFPAIALLTVAACTPDASEDPPLRIAATSPDAAQRIIAENTTHGLTAHDSAGQVIPGLAQSWRVSDDGLSIVFRLRPAQFADGRPVTAADAVASLRGAARRGAPMVRSLMAGVASVSAPLADVVEITLTTPQPEILELLAHPELAVAPRGRGPLRAGPFVRSRSDEPAGTRPPPVLLARSDSFHDADGIALAAAEVRSLDPEAAIAAFRANAADIVTGGELDGLGSARIVGATNVLRLETSRAAFTLLLNQSDGPLADRKVRRAIAMAIDRDRIGPRLFGTTAAVGMAGLVPPEAGGARPAALPDWQTLSLVQRREEALRLMAEAGHGPDNRLSLTISIASGQADEQLLELIGADLASIGIDIALGSRSAAAHAEAVARGEFDVALVRRASPITSPLPFLDPLRCGRNRHGSCLAEADRLLDESWKAPTPAERAALLAAAERLWAEDAAAIGLVQPVRWALVSRRVSGWTPNPVGVHPLRFLSFDPQRRLLK